MEISVILAYYRNLSDLKLLLDAFENQSYRDFELIVAEDDHNPETERFLETAGHSWTYPVGHVHQETKKGFRKTAILNAAVRIAKGKLLVFIDGDCIPHRFLLEEYHKNAGENRILAGRRVLLGPKTTEKIRTGRFLRSIGFWSVLFSDSTRIKEAIYWPYFRLYLKERKLSGCNWGVRKEDLAGINGFDEEFVRPGVGEDHDVEWRLKANGASKISMKNRAIVYHLHHARNSTKQDAAINESLMRKKYEAHQVVCTHGLNPVK